MTFRSLLRLFFVSLIISGLSACEWKAGKTTPEHIKAEYKVFKDEMDRNMYTLSKKINLLEARMIRQGDSMETELNDQLQEVKAMREDLGEKIEKLNESAKDKYVDIKTDIKKSYEELEAEVEKLTN